MTYIPYKYKQMTQTTRADPVSCCELVDTVCRVSEGFFNKEITKRLFMSSVRFCRCQ